MKHLKVWTFLSAVVALAGCASKIQSGQLDFDHGVAYKHGSTDPYTGTVHFNDVPPFVSDQLRFPPERMTGTFVDPLASTDNCDVEFKNGVVEGYVICHDRGGDRSITFSVRNQRTDGEEVIYGQGGGKAFEYHWADGQLDGDQRIWSAEGKYVMHEWHEDHGRKTGEEVRRNADGSRLSKGEWGDDGKYTGTIYVPKESAVYTLKDGVKEGAYFRMDESDESKHVVDGNYRDGQQDGPWVYRGSVAVDQLLKEGFSHDFGMRLDELFDLPQASSVELTWSKGTPSGPVKVYDVDKHVLLTFNLQSEDILPPVVRIDPATGKHFVFSDAATLSALNAVSINPPPSQGAPSIDPSCARAQSPWFCEQNLMRKAWEQKRDGYDALVKHVIDPIHVPDPAATPPSTSAIVPDQGATSAQAARATPSAAMPPQPAAACSAPAQVVAASASVATAMVASGADNTLAPCVDAWTKAYRKEVGQDAIVTQDQLDEWHQWCGEGKKPSQSQLGQL